MKFKVVINVCHGGFDLSEEAFGLLSKRTGKTLHQLNDEYIFGGTRKDGARSCPDLIAIVEELGVEAAACEGYSELEVVELEDPVGRYAIDEYDGWENAYTPAEMNKRWSIALSKEGK
jgi:hypothetical protein